MLGITLSAKRNFYACQCLDNVEMYTYAKFDQTSIPSGYKVMSIQQRQNHRQRMDSSESYWLLKCVMTPNLCSGFCRVSFKTQTCLARKEDFSSMQNITTEEQTINDLVKQRKWLTLRVRTKEHLKLSHGEPS